MATTPHVPDALPVLSRGKHRNPRKGACFMETASVLANERWSDKPACTDPLLGHLARLVNDLTSDRHRNELAVMVPDVIGVHGDGVDWDVAVAGAVTSRAILDAPETSQRALAVGLLRCLDAATDPSRAGLDEIRAALARVPLAERWARDLLASAGPITPRSFHRYAAPASRPAAGLSRATAGRRAARRARRTTCRRCRARRPPRA